jgi:WD40 repeat protein
LSQGNRASSRHREASDERETNAGVAIGHGGTCTELNSLPANQTTSKKQLPIRLLSISFTAFLLHSYHPVHTQLVFFSHQSRLTAISKSWRIICGAGLLLATTFIVRQAQGDDLFVASYDSTVSKITNTGNVSTIIGGMDIFRGLAFDGDGNLFVTHNDVISKITKTGVVSIFAKGLHQPYGLAFDFHGDLYVANAGDDTIVKVTSAGVVSTFATGLRQPSGIAFDASGTLFVLGAQGRIYKVTNTGQVSTFVYSIRRDTVYAESLALNSDGDLFVSGSPDNTILKVTKTGIPTVFATGIHYALGLAFDSHGDLFVANNEKKIFKVTQAGVASIFFTDLSAIPRALAFEHPLPPPPKSTPTAPPLADPQAELKIFVKDMGRLWRNDDFATFIQIYGIPGEFDSELIKEGQQATMSKNPQIQERHEQMAQAFDSLANLTPTLNANGDEATYMVTSPPGKGSSGINGPIVMIKINGKWYVKL